MQTLDLNAYGVQEMNRREMVETDGGVFGWIALTVVTYFVTDLLANPKAAADAWNAGKEKAYQ